MVQNSILVHSYLANIFVQCLFGPHDPQKTHLELWYRSLIPFSLIHFAQISLILMLLDIIIPILGVTVTLIARLRYMLLYFYPDAAQISLKWRMYTPVWNVILSILRSQNHFHSTKIHLGSQNWQDYISNGCVIYPKKNLRLIWVKIK